jgi:hypothetical protein
MCLSRSDLSSPPLITVAAGRAQAELFGIIEIIGLGRFIDIEEATDAVCIL